MQRWLVEEICVRNNTWISPNKWFKILKLDSRVCIIVSNSNTISRSYQAMKTSTFSLLLNSNHARISVFSERKLSYAMLFWASFYQKQYLTDRKIIIISILVEEGLQTSDFIRWWFLTSDPILACCCMSSSSWYQRSQILSLKSTL